MIDRALEEKLLQLARKFPIVSITGPRQSGKSTLIRHAFANYDYISFENPDTRELFIEDPRSFLERHSDHVIFDEAQRVPELFSYLQEISDSANIAGNFILSGSQNFLLSKNISQSLAGRVGILRLLPLSYAELEHADKSMDTAWEWVFRGTYPRVIADNIDPYDYYPSYIETYLERDVRQALRVEKIEAFLRFLQLLALRSGELLNISSLARECDLAPATVKNWISVLSASYIVRLLHPYATNPGKRLVKTPKLYFYDTGLACNLLGIESVEDLETYPQRGALFETAIVSELMKAYFNKGRVPAMYFWRDSNKNEIDVVIEKGPLPVKAIEIKSSTTYRSKYFDVLERIAPHDLKLSLDHCAVVYGGNEFIQTKRGLLIPFKDTASLI